MSCHVGATMRKLIFRTMSVVVLLFLGFLAGNLYASKMLWFWRDPDGIETPLRVQYLVNELAAMREGDTQTVTRELEVQLVTQLNILAYSPFEWPEKGKNARERAIGFSKVYFERYPMAYRGENNQLMPLIQNFATPVCSKGTCWPATRRLIDPNWSATQPQISATRPGQ